MTLIRTIICIAALALPTFAADARALFGSLPTTLFKNVDRVAAVESEDAARGFLKLRLPEPFAGEFLVISESKKETLVGLSVYSCEESELEIWRLRGGEWKDVTKDAGPKLGADDVKAMLAVSPVTVEKLGQEVSVPYFFTFGGAGDPLRLAVRRQTGCEVAGTAREFRFEGGRYRLVNGK